MEAEAIIMYTNSYFPYFSTPSGYLSTLGVAAAAALIALFTVIQVIGVNVFGNVNTAITIWKFIVPSLTVVPPLNPILPPKQLHEIWWLHTTWLAGSVHRYGAEWHSLGLRGL